jgi:uncharacterized protein (DUF2235 family)
MPDAAYEPSSSHKKRIAILLDGTWNTVNDNTNVWRLKSLLAPMSSDGLQQLVYYSTGVGTVFGELPPRTRGVPQRSIGIGRGPQKRKSFKGSNVVPYPAA